QLVSQLDEVVVVHDQRRGGGYDAFLDPGPDDMGHDPVYGRGGGIVLPRKGGGGDVGAVVEQRPAEAVGRAVVMAAHQFFGQVCGDQAHAAAHGVVEVPGRVEIRFLEAFVAAPDADDVAAL